MNRLPILVKLTAAFAAATLLMLAAAALFVYLRLRADLDDRVDANLRARAVAAGGCPRPRHRHRAALRSRTPRRASPRCCRARVCSRRSGRPIGAAITPAEVAEALRHDLVVERRLPGIDGTARILVVRHESTAGPGRHRGRSVAA